MLKVFLKVGYWMINEFIKAASLIFMAEMGDKTQIIAMTFATQYMVKHVLSGVALGVLANHGIAIVLGAIIGSMISGEAVNFAAGGLFIIFGWNALRMDESEDVEKRLKLHPVLAVALAFFIGELGDKTPLHLSRYYPVYKRNNPPTTQDVLEKLYEAAKKYLSNVYLGNVSGITGQDTYCSSCATTVTKRNGYSIKLMNLTAEGKCKNCGNPVYRYFTLPPRAGN